jgi:hypothetical protein
MQTESRRGRGRSAIRVVAARFCCGGSTAATPLVALLLAGASLVGCGSGGSSGSGGVSGAGGVGSTTITDTAARAPIATSCPDAALAALEEVAHRVYRESAEGRIVAQAAYRLSSSAALARAVELDEPAAARRVLRGLLENQIVSVRVARAGRTFAEIDRGIGIAPVDGRLIGVRGQVVGAFAVSVQGANGYAQTTSGLTATEVLLRRGSRLLTSTLRPAPALAADQRDVADRGVAYRVDTFSGRAFPTGTLSISLLVPSSSIASVCKPRGASPALTAAEASAETLGLVDRRVYYAEHAGSKAELILGYVERSRAFREAVLAGDPVATRAAIIGFFRSHLHIVRVRVIREGRLLIDVGGPHVLGPIPGVVRNARGRVVADIEVAIQDDLGFTLLAHAFTGAKVLMREGALQVMGDLAPGPASIPERGRLVYRGVPYQAYSFDAEAFPAGPLRISLLFGAAEMP